MGLIKAIKDAVGSVVADQWLEYFYCDSLSNEVLVTKGKKRVTEGRNSNTKSSDNVISNGSGIVVNEGQCMIIVDQGEIVEFCADPGNYTYEASSEPSLFYGDLGENIMKTFQTIGKRFAFGGSTGKDQRVYYFNIKEIMGNLYGTAAPIEFHLVSPRTGFEFDTVVRCNGEYSFKIVDPLLFYKNVCGNVDDEFTKSGEEGAKLLRLMKQELLTKLPTALAPIAAQGVLPYQLGNYTEAICDSLKQGLTEKWTLSRGIEVVSMTIAASVPEEARDALNKWNETAMLTNSAMQEAKKTEAFAEFMSKSTMGGGQGGTDPMSGMMGMMAMNMMGGMMNGNNNMMGNNMMNNAQQQNMAGANMGGVMPNAQAVPRQEPVLGWTCNCGKTDNRNKFCEECGSPKPTAAGWTCSCGKVNQGKFCPECGSPKPQGAPMYKCDKCGWEPEDPTKPPKFCPECGDIFDDNDKQ
uniref:SPFH domain-containing protein n=1 Tax=Acetatifactor sp. TaxID=1872090 RepID=UPI0040570EE4